MRLAENYGTGSLHQRRGETIGERRGNLPMGRDPLPHSVGTFCALTGCTWRSTRVRVSRASIVSRGRAAVARRIAAHPPLVPAGGIDSMHRWPEPSALARDDSRAFPPLRGTQLRVMRPSRGETTEQGSVADRETSQPMKSPAQPGSHRLRSPRSLPAADVIADPIGWLASPDDEAPAAETAAIGSPAGLTTPRAVRLGDRSQTLLMRPTALASPAPPGFAQMGLARAQRVRAGSRRLGRVPGSLAIPTS